MARIIEKAIAHHYEIISLDEAEREGITSVDVERKQEEIEKKREIVDNILNIATSMHEKNIISDAAYLILCLKHGLPIKTNRKTALVKRVKSMKPKVGLEYTYSAIGALLHLPVESVLELYSKEALVKLRNNNEVNELI